MTGRGMGTLRRAIFIAAAAALAAALTVPPAAASTKRYTFTGDGWGHGLGMGQYGAKGAAEAGRSYASILQHFYRGTTVASQTLPGGLRIGLQQNASSISISGDGRFDFVLKGTVVGRGRADQWSVRPTSNGQFQMVLPDGTLRTVGTSSNWLGVQFTQYGTLLKTGGLRYKYGWLELNITKSGTKYVIRSILHVAPFDRYILGLGEMPSSWHMEALKAQATAARTYAVEKIRATGVRSTCNCHVYDDTRDQVYTGYEKEAASGGDRWISAVQSTASKLVLYGGKPIKAFYHSSDGGHTEHNENVWGGTPIPYLRGVSDPWDPNESPYKDWSVVFTHSQLQTRLASSSSTNVGTLSSIAFLSPRGVSGRVTRVIDSDSGGVLIKGSAGQKRVGGDTLRSVLGLRSTLMYLKVETVA